MILKSIVIYEEGQVTSYRSTIKLYGYPFSHKLYNGQNQFKSNQASKNQMSDPCLITQISLALQTNVNRF